MKKTILALSGLGLLAAPVVATVSCSATIKKSYDFGLATAPINSLNYIKYKNAATVAPAIVEGLFKIGSSDKVLQSLLNFPTIEFKMASGSENKASFLGNYLPLNEYGLLPGSMITSAKGIAAVGLAADQSDPSTYSQLVFQLNDKHKWSSWTKDGATRNDYVTAKDYVDTIKYILDLNTGSQLVVDIQEYGIKNSSKIIDLQNEYYRKFKTTYKNPFGYKDFIDPITKIKYGQWESQLDSQKGWTAEQKADELKLVAQIKEAAQGLGVFSKEQLTNGESIGVKGTKWFDSLTSGNQVDESRQLFFQFEDSKPLQRIKVLEWSRRTFFLPTNRDFVESTGGIQKFGIDKSHILWNSAFVPESINLGPAGFIDLVKDNNYYAAERTVSNRIKIFFQSDPTVTASMYEDGYISDVKIPAVQQLNFWADPNIRRYMSKSTGFGTLAFELNLGKTGNEALKNANLRKAIAYSIDRNAISLVAGQESSFPVTTWTSFGVAKDTTGNPVESYFDQESYKPVSDDEYNSLTADQKAAIPATLPIQSYSYSLHNSKLMQFERVNRDDIGFNPTLAKYFLAKYREDYAREHNGAVAPKVTLKYVYDGQTVNKNMGIYLQSQLNEILGGAVDVEIKGLPANVFETYKTTGEFDILYYNFDSYGSDWDSYIKRFFEADDVLGVDKTQGFDNNPSGGWTYKDFFANLSPEETIKVKQILNTSSDAATADKIWNKLIELANATPEKRNGFFAKQDKTDGFNSDEMVIKVISAFEKIIRYAMPVLPLMEVDTYWEAKRVAGSDSLWTFALQTAYDVENKPNPGLPGIAS